MFELASIVVLGILAQWLAWRLKVPAILPLIIIGLVVGPLSTYVTEDGLKFIQPVFANGRGLFPNSLLFYFVSLAIGIILFEGGLTLKRSEIKDVGSVILRLISLGSLVTFIGGGYAAHYTVGLSWSLSFLFSGLIIVTGPTVIAPILRNIPLNKNVSTVLKWEGILIDPIGALVAVLVFNFILKGEELGSSYSLHALGEFGKIVIIGLSLGFASAYFLKFMIEKKQVPHYLVNVFSLALVVFMFVISDAIIHESGLLTVVIMGMVFGNINVHEAKEILYFKESLSILLISILFILLAANINIDELLYLISWNCLALFFIVVLLLRPLGVFMSTIGSNLDFNEKLFISWVGPRGIVAAGIASLFGITLKNNGVPGGELMTPLVFLIVLGTVMLNATTARWVASLLGVTKQSSDGILIIGASLPARIIGKYLKDNNRHVAIVDSNAGNVKKAKDLGLEAIQTNIYNDDLQEHLELLDMGFLMAMTGSSDVNNFALNNFSQDYGERGAFRLITPDEMDDSVDKLPSAGLFSPNDDYINLSEVARDYPNIHELDIDSASGFETLVKTINKEKNRIPLFLKDREDKLHIIPSDLSALNPEQGWKLVYLGTVV